MGHTLSFETNVSKPTFPQNEANKDKVFIKVLSAAINPVDYKLPRFLAGSSVVGLDVCGIVEEVGKNIVGDHMQVGDVVYGKATTGSLAEYTTARASEVAKAPPPSSSVPDEDSWKPEELASLQVAYVSALQCLQKGNIVNSSSSSTAEDEDKTVLVIGASGGCGIAGLQLCRAVGVKRIVAICSAKNVQYVQDAGATQVVDYNAPTEMADFFQNNVGLFDCVFDVATGSGGGEDYREKSLVLLKKDTGKYTALNGSPSNWFRKFASQEKENQHMILCQSNTADLTLVVELLNKISVRPLTTVMPFTEEGIQEAFRQLKSRRTKGKLAFNISEKSEK